MYKLIVLDLDGTLLDNNHNISPKTIKLLNDLIKKGYKIIFASGRPFRSVSIYAKDLIKPILIISDNGAFIGYSDNETFNNQNSFSKEEFIHLFSLNKDIINNAWFSVGNNIYIYNRIAKLEPLYHIDQSTNIIEGAYDEIDIEVPMSAMFVVNTLFKERFEKCINAMPNIKYRGVGTDKKNSVYEISQSKLDKVLALMRILSFYKIDHKEIIAIGDGDNDLGMLEFAGLGVGMKNASSIIRENIKTITKYDNNHEGVYRFLSELEL